MGKKLLALLVLFELLGFKPPDNQGIYRWDYKILIDTAGLRVFSMPAHRASIHSLEIIPRPSRAEMHNKRAEAEKRKVIVTAYVVEAGKEDNDNDYHLVLTSLNGKDSLIAEIPDPLTPKLSGFPGLRSDFIAGRTFVEQNIKAHPGNVEPLPHRIKVKVTGVIFFDKTAHGNGHSINGVEIHPILDIKRAN